MGDAPTLSAQRTLETVDGLVVVGELRRVSTETVVPKNGTTQPFERVTARILAGNSFIEVEFFDEAAVYGATGQRPGWEYAAGVAPVPVRLSVYTKAYVSKSGNAVINFKASRVQPGSIAA